MAGSLVLTVGSLTATNTYTATNAKIETVVREAAEEAGYNEDYDAESPPDPLPDAATDAAQTVADWIVIMLTRHMKALSNADRLNTASDDARADEQAVIDSEGDL